MLPAGDAKAIYGAGYRLGLAVWRESVRFAVVFGFSIWNCFMTKVIDRFRTPLPRRFPEWIQNRYAAAVHELKKLDDGSARYWAFAWECLASAETARAWKAANKRFEFDSDSVMRKSDERYFETLEDLISSVNVLATQLERYPSQAAWTVGQALLELKSEVGYLPLKSLTSTKDGLNPFGYGPGTAPDIVSRLLRHMSAVLAVAKTQKSVQWKQFGPILFEEFPTAGGRPPDMLVRGLLFEAVFFSRTFIPAALYHRLLDDQCQRWESRGGPSQ